jgi:hypothetical protein
MMARDMEDDEQPDGSHLAQGEGTKEIEEEIRDNHIASLNDF